MDIVVFGPERRHGWRGRCTERWTSSQILKKGRGESWIPLTRHHQRTGPGLGKGRFSHSHSHRQTQVTASLISHSRKSVRVESLQICTHFLKSKLFTNKNNIIWAHLRIALLQISAFGGNADSTVFENSWSETSHLLCQALGGWAVWPGHHGEVSCLVQAIRPDDL